MARRAVVVTSVVLLGLGRAVWAMVVEVRHVLGQHCREMAAIDDQYPVEKSAADSSNPSFGDRVRLRRPHRVRRIRMLSLANTASKTLVNLLSRSRINNLN